MGGETGLTLFQTNNPAEVVARAEAMATVLADVLDKRELVLRIGRRGHVLVEGWTLLGSMVGVFAEVEWSRPLVGPTGAPIGWEARAVARTMEGRQVGSAEAQCSRAESHWADREDYALRSMAQTRAVSKALRMPLGFIVELAGYSATPAEELPPEDRRPEPQAPAPRRGTANALRQSIADAALVKGLGGGAVAAIAQDVGVVPGARATVAQLRAIQARVNELPTTAQELEASGIGTDHDPIPY